MAVSRALMRRVARGELPETLRIARPAAVVAFAKRDAVAEGYREARGGRASRPASAPCCAWPAGRAAVFHEDTLEVAHAAPDPDPRAGHPGALRDRGRARAPGPRAGWAWTPGWARWRASTAPGAGASTPAARRKLAGIGQRVVAGGSHTGTVLVVDGAARVRAVLEPVYAALGLDWDPATVGAVGDELPGASWEQVRDALLAEYAPQLRARARASSTRTRWRWPASWPRSTAAGLVP